MPTELDSSLFIREILMRVTAHGDLTTKGSDLANTEVDNNFIVLYETLKSTYNNLGVKDYSASITYPLNDIVIESNIAYLSLQAANTGNTPGIVGSELWWGLCSMGDFLKWALGDASIISGLTATGTNQATAKVLTRKVNRIDTVASGTGVVNEAAEVAGDKRTVQNNGANDLTYYPFLGSNFYVNGTGAMADNAGYNISPGNQLTYIVYDDGELTII